MSLRCGIDLGSRNIKIALLHQPGEKLKLFQYDTIEFYRRRGRMRDGRLVLDLAGLPGLDMAPDSLVCTGYGRQTVDVEGAKTVPEIKAHVLGAVYLSDEKNFTLLDLGGQDSKVALVREGKLVDFLTNDKCAASTGRYLENMATVLGLSLEELSQYSADPVELSATCAIFGESELIGRILEGHSIARLAAGVNYTIFKRIHPLLRQLASEKIVFTGGVSRNRALVEILARETELPVLVPPHAAYAGAIGCCLRAGME
ncbi:acyl-CoA dehydratase activase [Desulfurispora thermophila]|uniref:acyl-CoA dehydratase activase n=1 Tax=Desulfurispora thermophila TaxID=265470 RepID=UPI0003803547|nr:acyl-CoA dehydratase activase [Desulfurispora thermophila]